LIKSALSKYPLFKYFVEANKALDICGKTNSLFSTKSIDAPNASASTYISSGATADGMPLNLNVLVEVLAIFPASLWT
jgi:hypothetical protein